jgi:hypothetical protein
VPVIFGIIKIRGKLMPSLHDTRCPTCGVEKEPCLYDNGYPLYHESRRKLAYPVGYDSPCGECNELKRILDAAEDAKRSWVPGISGKPKSKRPKAYREMFERSEDHAKKAREDYEFHQQWRHHDVGTRVELIPRTAEEIRISLSKLRVRDPSKEGVVTATGYLNGKQTVVVTFDDGTSGAPNSYADEFRKLY